MIIRIENQWTNHTYEFVNSDASIEDIINAFRGMLLSEGFHIETINRYLKTDEDI